MTSYGASKLHIPQLAIKYLFQDVNRRQSHPKEECSPKPKTNKYQYKIKTKIKTDMNNNMFDSCSGLGALMAENV